MGLFSKTKTVVGTSVSRVIEDDLLPDALLQGMTANLVGDGEQLTEQVMESLASSLGTRAARMYRFGDNGYIYGRPTGNVFSSFAAKTQVEAVIESQVGMPVSLAYYHFCPLNLMHIAWKKLTENFGYDAVTNKIGSLCTATKQVYLQDMVLMVVDATVEEQGNESLAIWGTPANAGYTPDYPEGMAGFGQAKPATSYVVSGGLSEDTVQVSYCWIEKVPAMEGSTITKDVFRTDTFTLSLSGYDPLADWHHAKYVTQSGVTGYWVYQDRAGTYPNIDNVFHEGYSEAGDFFPWLYFRFDKQSMLADKTSQGYKDSKRIASMMEMDFDQVAEGIHDNPDIADVEQAMMVMAVPANTNNALECRYLFDFFSGVYEQQQHFDNAGTQEKQYTIRSLLDDVMNRSTMIFQDKRFKMALNWRNIVKKTVYGTIGAVGSYNGASTTTPERKHWYQYQVSVGVYIEIQVYELAMTYFVEGNYSVTSDGDNKDILLIPVDYAITQAYSIPDRNTLYSRSLHYVFNSLVVIKLQWYQTGIFKALLIIVAVVVTVMSLGSTWQSIVAAVAAGAGTAAIVMILVLEILNFLIFQLAFKIFVKVVGAKVAIIAAFVAAVVGSYQAIEAGSLNGAPFAKELLAVSSGLSKAIGSQLKDDFGDLLQERHDFMQFVEDQTKLLDSTKELLNHNEYLAPLVIFGEKPTDFYQRTVHSGNIGVIGIEAVTSFVDVALTLPTISETL